MVRFTFFIILFFSGFQLYAFWPHKISAVSPEAIRQLFFLYIFLGVTLILPGIELKKYERNIFIYFVLFLLFLSINALRGPSIFIGATDLVKLSYVLFVYVITTQLVSIYGIERVQIMLKEYLSVVLIFFIAQVGLSLISSGYVSPDTGEFMISAKAGRSLGSMISSILAIYFYNNFQKNKNYGDLLIFMVLFILTFLSFTRIAILGLCFSFLFITFFYRRYKMLLLIALILTPLFLIFSKALIAESFIRNGEGLKELLFSNPLEIFKQIRLTGRDILWFLAFKGFLKSPIIGNGLGYSNLLIKNSTVIIEQVHNDYLKLMSDVGIIGLFFYINLFAFMVYQAIKIYKANPETKCNFSLFVSTVIQIMIFSMTDNVISYGPYVLIYVFISYALLVRSNGEKQYENHIDNEFLHPLQI